MNEYISPIMIIQTELNTELENNVYKAVTKYDIAVDKEELIKALKYDRNQYNLGYNRGFQDGVYSEEDENKALRLLLKWAVECDFGYDNFPEEYECYKEDIEDMDYIEGMIYIAKKVIEEKANESSISD